MVFGAPAHVGSGWGTACPKQSITVCSDGSWHAESQTSSWAVCYADDEFQQCFGLLPPEGVLRSGHLAAHGVCHFGDSISPSVSSGIFMAELQGALRAISSLPATWDVEVVLDSKSALMAIQAYAEALTERTRIRMKGRPLLALVHKQVQQRVECGGSVTWVHTKSHTGAVSVQAVGNSCADVVAAAARSLEPDERSQLDLRLGESWLYVQSLSADTAGQVVSSDIREVARSTLSDCSLVQWRLGSSKQGAYADRGWVDLYGWLAKHSDKQLRAATSLVLRLATDTLHFFYDADDEKQHVKERTCSVCIGASAMAQTVAHAFECPQQTVERRQVLAQLVAAVEKVPLHSAQAWVSSVDVSAADGLQQQVAAALFGLGGDGESAAKCRVRVLCGGFSVAEGRKAMSALGIGAKCVDDSGMEWRAKVLAEWREVLFRYVFACSRA